ncbi:MAG: radical SAM protein [Clostridiales bacterium]|nr:radical SAM protein [Clostridiales bacterium]
MKSNLCNLCPRSCNVERTQTQKGAFCKMPNTITVARAALHFWEEPCISGKNGSGTVFFSGCSLKCVFCQNYSISHECFGKEISVEHLVEIFNDLADKGANNINLVNPTHFALLIKEALEKFNHRLPVIYNSSGYEKVETLRELEGLIDVYLPDLKYITAEKSKKYSNAENYFDYAAPAILEMHRQVGQAIFDENGIIKRGLIIRHLILPKNTNESIKVLKWISENLPSDTYISLMGQYTPFGKTEDFPELNRKITKREYDKVINAMLDFNLSNGFVQDTTCADTNFIPNFDLEGV